MELSASGRNGVPSKQFGRRASRSQIDKASVADTKLMSRSTEALLRALSIDTKPESVLPPRRWLRWAPRLPAFSDLSSYRTLYICTSAVAFANAMTFSALGPFLPAYAQGRFGLNTSQVGLMMAAYPFLNLITSPCCGALINCCGRWNVLFAGLCVLAAATALYGLAGSAAWLFVASGLHGTSLSLVHISSLALLSAYPEKLTEAMGGIEVWSGVALVVGPPLGGLIYPHWGVQGVFLSLSLWPLAMICCIPGLRSAIAGARDGPPEDPMAAAVPISDVLRSRSTLGAALVTVCNYGVIGFLEVTLSTHLDAALGTSPSTIGFVFILPSLLYSAVAANTEAVVEFRGAKRTMLWGFTILSASLYLHGPSPFLAPILPSPVSVRFAVATGMLAFQVGSALAVVPAFAAMQGGVAHLGRGADNVVASLHSLSIGAGEVIGPIFGGLMMELMPATAVLGCHPQAAAAAAATRALKGGTSVAAAAAAAAAVALAGPAVGGAGAVVAGAAAEAAPSAAEATIGAVRAVTAAARHTRRLLEGEGALFDLGGEAPVPEAGLGLLHGAATAAEQMGHSCLSAFPAASSIVATLLLVLVVFVYWLLPPDQKRRKGARDVGGGEESAADGEEATLVSPDADSVARHRPKP